MSIESSRLLVAAATLAALLMGAGANAATQYNITPLGLLPGGHYLDAYAVNDAGLVTGYGYSQGTNLGFVWQQGQLTSLGTLPGGGTSGGYGINNAGVIAGSSGSDAFVWQNGLMQKLPRLAGADYGHAYAINDSGEVAGSSGGTAVVWRNGQLVALPGLNGQDHALAISINNQGVMAGISYTASYNPLAVIWRDGQLQVLGSSAYVGAGATDIANNNTVAGFVELGGNLSQAARWDNGQITLLSNLAGSDHARAYGINDAGLVVGTSFAGSDSGAATLWEGTEAIALQDLVLNGDGWRLWQAQDISNAGHIIGWGQLNGQAQSFLLTPVPEASTTSYVLIGMLLLLFASRRKSRSVT